MVLITKHSCKKSSYIVCGTKKFPNILKQVDFLMNEVESYFSSVSSAVTLACSVSWSSCCSSKSLRTFRRTPSRRSTSPSLSSTCRFKAFTRRDSWEWRGTGRGLEGNRGGHRWRRGPWGMRRGQKVDRKVGRGVCGFVGKQLRWMHIYKKGWDGRKMIWEERSGSVLGVFEWGWVWVKRDTEEISLLQKKQLISVWTALVIKEQVQVQQYPQIILTM